MKLTSKINVFIILVLLLCLKTTFGNLILTIKCYDDFNENQCGFDTNYLAEMINNIKTDKTGVVAVCSYRINKEKTYSLKICDDFFNKSIEGNSNVLTILLVVDKSYRPESLLWGLHHSEFDKNQVKSVIEKNYQTILMKKIREEVKENKVNLNLKLLNSFFIGVLANLVYNPKEFNIELKTTPSTKVKVMGISIFNLRENFKGINYISLISSKVDINSIDLNSYLQNLESEEERSVFTISSHEGYYLQLREKFKDMSYISLIPSKVNYQQENIGENK